MKSYFSGVLLVGALFIAGPAIADDESCKKIYKEYVGKRFVSKEPLYDTLIGHDGIIKLERDKEEIRPGAVCRVKDIECSSKRVEVVLKQVLGTKEFNKVEIRFQIHKVERQGPNGMNDFRKMWAYVLEDVSAEDKTGSESQLY